MTQFSSRPPFNHDPTPWAGAPGPSNMPNRYGSLAVGEGSPFWDTVTYDPRPEFAVTQTNPTNRLLHDFRQLGGGRDNYARWVRDFDQHPTLWIEQPGRELMFGGHVGYTAAEISHARRVLSRLASLSQEAVTA